MAGAPNTHVCYHPRRKARHDEAIERLNLRGLLSPREQLAQLDRRLGKGVGAKRERARLAKQSEAR